MATRQIIRWNRPRWASPFSKHAKSHIAEADKLKAYKDAVVDAATVGATLWFSYLFVLFYLLVAVAGVTHTDLFLENPVKLPFLNVDLPLVGFFWFGPTLFLIVHAYVLLHFSLLTRKARALEFELSRASDRGIANEQRELLPNNIFVQLLAGPHDSRAGLIGLMLRIIVIVSLAVGPVSLLVFFVLQFLPYHSSSVTWWQRLAVILDLSLVWSLWPFIIGGLPLTVGWRSRFFRYVFGGELLTILTVIFVFMIATFPGEFLDSIPFSVRFIPIPAAQPSRSPTYPPGGLRIPAGRQMLVLHRTADGQMIVSRPPTPPQELADQEKSENEVAADKMSSLKTIEQWLGSIGWVSLHRLLVDGEIDLRTQRPRSIFANRLVIPGFDLRADPKFDSMTKIASLPRTVSWRSRNLRGAVLIDSTLPKADFTAADLSGAYFDGADLRAAIFGCAPSGLETGTGLLEAADADSDCARLEGARFIASRLQGANFQGAQAKEASFSSANLRGAFMSAANLQGANFWDAHLEGAMLSDADLRGASLSVAHSEGADLSGVDAQGANFVGSHLEGASLARANLQIANFWRAHLQASLLSDVDLEGAYLDDADLEGSVLGRSDPATQDDDTRTKLQGASFRGTWVWRTDASNVDGTTEVRAINVRVNPRPVCPNEQQNDRCKDPKEVYEQLTRVIKDNVPTGPDLPSWWDPQAKALERIRRLNPEASLANEETTSNFWNSMKPIASEKDSPYEISLAKLLIKSGCADDGAPYVAAQMLNLFSERVFSKESSQPRLVAEAILDKQRCPASALLSEYQNDAFRRLRDGTWLFPDDSPN
jgi:uncharacterized protein YjbI with pentapeptide repeats